MEVNWEQNDYPYSLVLLFLPKDLLQPISGWLSHDYKVKNQTEQSNACFTTCNVTEYDEFDWSVWLLILHHGTSNLKSMVADVKCIDVRGIQVIRFVCVSPSCMCAQCAGTMKLRSY